LYDRYGQFRFADGCCYGYGQAHLLQRVTSLEPSARAGPSAHRFEDAHTDPDKYVRILHAPDEYEDDKDQGPVPNTAYKPDDGRGTAVPELVFKPRGWY
jgi:hypothetical protein